jgi:hypothetical protein
MCTKSAEGRRSPGPFTDSLILGYWTGPTEPDIMFTVYF